MDRFVQAYAASPLLFWLLGSVLAYGVGTNLLWLGRSRGLQPPPGARLLGQTARFLFFLCIPYLALGGWPRRSFQGLLSPKDMGFVGLSLDWPVTRWLEAAGLGLGLGLAALVILFIAWRYAGRSAEGLRLTFPPRAWWAIVVDGLYLEVHWAFYRGALAVLRDDVYTGVFWGLVLVYLEWSSSPFWRRGWRTPSRAAEQWLHAALALVAALVFLLTQNLWVCLGVHLGLALSFWTLGRVGVHAADTWDSQIP